jgi:hypothetical protein
VTNDVDWIEGDKMFVRQTKLAGVVQANGAVRFSDGTRLSPSSVAKQWRAGHLGWGRRYRRPLEGTLRQRRAERRAVAKDAAVTKLRRRGRVRSDGRQWFKVLNVHLVTMDRVADALPPGFDPTSVQWEQCGLGGTRRGERWSALPARIEA